ncbi:hypothetical protein NQ318_003241 [Aromia moschata]|uniref:Enoyl-CoA delta isomerase 2, mitochondrial n=1 Tax=Aromia moschata TaxID=1265417 RepID=A0AAV8YPE3_9CUCU|nr:hypothetical protein NQ318_003241 [Aromia moschata]
MDNNFILIDHKDGVRTIRLNRPDKKNAMCTSMYRTLTSVLNDDAKDDKVVVTILTGCGGYFTSGNDIKTGLSEDISTETRLKIVQDMVTAFIDYPKLLIAIVNGPAIGIGATMAVLCDIIYVTDKALFDLPFVKLGLCAEAASSFTFPYILGRSKASEMLYLNHQLDAREAYHFGLVSKVIPHDQLDNFINELRRYGRLPVNSVKLNKKLVMASLKAILSECNQREMEQLSELFKD